MRRTHSPFAVFSDPVLVGAVTTLIVVIGVLLTYSANKGLPFIPTVQIFAQLGDAREMVPGEEVRIGGARVGIVKSIEAEPRKGKTPPYAKLELALKPADAHLPVDSTVQVRPRSILGAKYLAITPGHSKHRLQEGQTLKLGNFHDTVELSDSFNVFGGQTARGIQNVINGLGDALAGRGTSINDGIYAFARLLPPAERVLQATIDPQTELPRFIDNTAATVAALAPVARTLGNLLDHGATTLAAIDNSDGALDATLNALPPTEALGTRVLRRADPVLDDAAALARGLRPATTYLPFAATQLDAAVRVGTPVLQRVPPLARSLGSTLGTLDATARDPSVVGAVRKLYAALVTLTPVTHLLVPAQLQCNVLGVQLRNFADVVSEGDAEGSWLRFLTVGDLSQTFQSAQPAANLHANPYPHENRSECEAGNEPYLPGQHIGHPAGNQANSTVTTSVDPAVRRLAHKAGLWP